MPAAVFAGLPPAERIAFFGVLDEYFSSRPHFLPGAGSASGTPAAAPSPSSAASSPPPAAAAASPFPTRADAERLRQLAPMANRAAGLANRFAGMRTSEPAAGQTASGASSDAKPHSVSSIAARGAALGSLFGSKAPAAAPAAAPAPQAAPAARAPAAARAPPSPPAAAPAAPTLGTATALYAYDGGEEEDLTVAEGETITLTERVNDEWWRGTNARGESGIVPANYLQIH